MREGCRCMSLSLFPTRQAGGKGQGSGVRDIADVHGPSLYFYGPRRAVKSRKLTSTSLQQFALPNPTASPQDPPVPDDRPRGWMESWTIFQTMASTI